MTCKRCLCVFARKDIVEIEGEVRFCIDCISDLASDPEAPLLPRRRDYLKLARARGWIP